MNKKSHLLSIFCAIVCMAAPIATAEEAAPLTAPLPDPMEGFNRTMQTFNQGFNNHVLYPLGVAYRAATPVWFRIGLHNFGENLGYPLRAINHLLQANFSDAWDDTKCFAVNTTVGVLGFRNQSEQWGMAQRDTDFGQTLGIWGVGQGCYVNLPVLGGGSARQAAGKLVDLVFPSIPSMLFPSECAAIMDYSPEVGDALDGAPVLRYLIRSTDNPYELFRALSVLEENAAQTPVEPPSVQADPEESLGFVLLTPENEEFQQWGYEHKIAIPGAASPLRYTCWPQKRFAPRNGPSKLMFLLPGLGGHREDKSVAAIAEAFHKAGWNVIAFSSGLAPETVRGMPGRRFPGVFSDELPDLARAIRLAEQDMLHRHQGAGADVRAVVGYSLGAIQALHLATLDKDSFPCDRFVAINPPRNPLKALRKIDKFFAIPAQWGTTQEERNARVQQLFLRLAPMLSADDEDLEGTILTREESQYIIGLAMRLPLSDLLQACADMKLCPAAGNLAKRLNVTWEQYVTDYVLPQYNQTHQTNETVESLADKMALDAIADKIGGDSRVRLLHAQNDFLLNEGDCAWFQGVLGPRAVILEKGSHLGALAQKDVLKSVLSMATP